MPFYNLSLGFRPADAFVIFFFVIWAIGWYYLDKSEQINKIDRITYNKKIVNKATLHIVFVDHCIGSDIPTGQNR